MTGDNDTPGELASLLADLVSIDSDEPTSFAAAPGGRDCGGDREWGSAAGLEVETLTEHPERPSVVVRARGSGGGGTLLLCGHIDTVGVAGMTEPFDARVDGDRLHGRGAYDMKGGVAAALLACRDATALGLAGDVVVAAVADEEHASVGVREVLRHVRADAAIVTEPTELEVAIAHRGFVWIEIEVRGRAAHGSRPHLGVDAIAHAGPILTGIGDLDSPRGAPPSPARPRLDPRVADRGRHRAVLLSRPMQDQPGAANPAREGAASVEAEIEEILAGTRRRVPGLGASQRTLLVREPFEIDADAELVGIVAAAVRERGLALHRWRQHWADAAFIGAAGIPASCSAPPARRAREWSGPLELRGRAGDARRSRQHICR